MPKREVIEKVSRFAEVVKVSFPVKKVILYGSYARGTARRDSDIDVAVVVRKIKGDFLKAAALLFKLSRNIDVRLEPILIEEGRDPSGFLHTIMKEGKVIYG